MKKDESVSFVASDGIVLTGENFSEVMSHMATSDRMFLNSECMLVEYYDIIKAPWYILLTLISQNEKIRPIIDVDKIAYMDTESLFEWYCNRKNRNFLLDLATAPETKVEYDEILKILMGNKLFYELDTSLNALDAVKIALKQKQVKEVVIYTEENDQNVKDDIQRLFGKNPNVKFQCGDFKKVLGYIPRDSSYMLSDFNKVIDMAEADKLNFSSIILPYDFAYNYITNDEGKKVPIIDFEYLAKDHVFKLNYFNACYQ